MAEYRRPVFTLSIDETCQGADFRRIDAYEIIDNEYGLIRYEKEESPDSVLEEIENPEEIEEAEASRIVKHFFIPYEKILDYNDRLRGSGLDVESGMPERQVCECYEPHYRAEFFDRRGVTEYNSRWVKTKPDEPEFENVFAEIEGEALNRLINSQLDSNPPVDEV